MHIFWVNAEEKKVLGILCEYFVYFKGSLLIVITFCCILSHTPSCCKFGIAKNYALKFGLRKKYDKSQVWTHIARNRQEKSKDILSDLCFQHRGKTESGPMISRTNNVSTVFNISQLDKKILKVWEMSDESFMVNQHVERITQPKFELQPHLALKTKHFFRKGILYLKIAGPIFFKMHL